MFPLSVSKREEIEAHSVLSFPATAGLAVDLSFTTPVTTYLTILYIFRGLCEYYKDFIMENHYIPRNKEYS